MWYGGKRVFLWIHTDQRAHSQVLPLIIHKPLLYRCKMEIMMLQRPFVILVVQLLK